MGSLTWSKEDGRYISTVESAARSRAKQAAVDRAEAAHAQHLAGEYKANLEPGSWLDSSLHGGPLNFAQSMARQMSTVLDARDGDSQAVVSLQKQQEAFAETGQGNVSHKQHRKERVITPADKQFKEALTKQLADLQARAEGNAPTHIVSFAQLEQAEAAGEVAQRVFDLSARFEMLVQNVMAADDVTDKSLAIERLTNEFKQRLSAQKARR